MRGYSGVDSVVPGPYLGSYFSLVGALTALILGGHGLFTHPRSSLHRSFAAFALTIALWEGGFVVVNAGTDKEAVWLAYRIASIGFCLLPAAATALVLRLCEVRLPWRAIGPVTVMGLVFLVQSWTGILYVADFVLTPGGNGYLHATDSPWYWSFQLTYLVHAANLVVLIRRWATAPGRRLRRQGAILSLSYLTVLVVHSLQSSLPSMTGVGVPWVITVIPANALLLAAQAWAMGRYRFLGLDAVWVDLQILRSVADPIARFGADRRPFWVNPAWTKVFGAGQPPFLADWRPDGPQEGTIAQGRWSVLSNSVALVRADGHGLARLDLDADEALVAQWAMEGMTNKEIAFRLGLSEGTVKNKMSLVLTKAGARNRADLRRRLG